MRGRGAEGLANAGYGAKCLHFQLEQYFFDDAVRKSLQVASATVIVAGVASFVGHVMDRGRDYEIEMVLRLPVNLG